MIKITDNQEKSRFELEENGKIAFADYTLHDEILSITHVEADPALRGTGAAGRLMAGLLENARVRGLKVQPICGYAVAYMKKNPQNSDLEIN